jgi:hypothetical protein
VLNQQVFGENAREKRHLGGVKKIDDILTAAANPIVKLGFFSRHGDCSWNLLGTKTAAMG